jgi:2-hydroxychromene-2-carboxylate isomerase
MTTHLEFFFDYGSPYSYLANSQLGPLMARTHCELAYRPMLLGGVFKATGNRSPAIEPIEAKRRYGAIEIRRFVAHYGCRFRPNPHFPINTLPIMRACHAATRQGVFELFHAAVFPAFWADGKNLGDEATFASVLDAAGLDSGALLRAASEPETKEALRKTTDEAVERGVFGAPTFFVGDEMFFGADRLGFVEAALGP